MKITMADLKKSKNFRKELLQSAFFIRMNLVLTNNAFHL